MPYSELIEKRNNDIRKLYLHFCFVYNTKPKNEILRIILKQPAPQFYITRRSFENYLYNRNKRKNKKYEEIKTIYDNLLQQNPTLYKFEAIDIAISMPASSFFISMRQLKKNIKKLNT